MASTLKRKGSPALEEAEESSKRRFAECSEPAAAAAVEEALTTTPTVPESEPSASSTIPPPDDRAARFAALRARNKASRKSNLAETKTEAKRASTDTTQLASLQRKRDIAAHKLLKAEIEDGGGDFERQRAWDWTIEESERWDERQAEKARNRENNVFADYSQAAAKVYDRQISMMHKKKGAQGGESEGGADDRLAAYEAEKAAAIDRAIRSGGLEIVETGSGELIAVDKDGTFLTTAEGPTHQSAGNKPSREAVDRLVDDIKKAEEVRLKKRRDRGRADEDGGDITYINEKNKQFNMKLARFYNKYTADIRDSFERGTAI